MLYLATETIAQTYAAWNSYNRIPGMIELYEDWLSAVVVHTARGKRGSVEVGGGGGGGGEWDAGEYTDTGCGGGVRGMGDGGRRVKVCRVWKCRGIYHSGLTV